MADKAAFSLRERNPDVLTSIANLSNDEVFTPPSFANQMLDTVAEAWAESNNGANIWADKTVTFLDPFTKSGVFLREIVRRLTEGLEKEIPDAQERVNHILAKQVFGVAITQLTALLARRSVYCSKKANGKHSIATSFTTPEGNIWFERTEHTWAGGKDKVITVDEQAKEIDITTDGTCKFCGAKQKEYERGLEAESHAYAVIHTDRPVNWAKDLFGAEMQFDVVIGNPPYQLGSDGGTRDIPIYQKFVSQAKALQPKLLSMVIPSRWTASGLGLADFRSQMLCDTRISQLHDFPVSKDVFPGVEVKGGVCFFLWDSTHQGECDITTYRDGEPEGPHQRKLDEYDVLVRDSRAIPILRKVLELEETSIVSILAVDKEFGWTSNFLGFSEKETPDSIPFHYINKGKRLQGYVGTDQVLKSAHLINTWKVLVPKAGSDGGQKIPDMVLGKPKMVGSPSVCTQSFLFFYLVSQNEAESVNSYLKTKFFRFLVSLRKNTQDATRSTYRWVPKQDFTRLWTDKQLYAKYKLTQDEIDFIESMIRPMELTSE